MSLLLSVVQAADTGLEKPGVLKKNFFLIFKFF